MNNIKFVNGKAICTNCELEVPKNQNGDYPSECFNCKTNFSSLKRKNRNHNHNPKYSRLKTIGWFFNALAFIQLLVGIFVVMFSLQGDQFGVVIGVVSGIVTIVIMIILLALQEAINLFINIANDVRIIRDTL